MTEKETAKQKEYENDSADEFFCRAEAILRAVYYEYKEAEIYGASSHEHLKMMVDSMIYNVLEAEKKITSISEDIPAECPPVHGNEKKFTEIMKKNMNQYYKDLRSMAVKRITKK